MPQPNNKNTFIKRKVNLIISLFVFVAFVVLCLSYFQSNVMNSVRAYVRGEGLWAKAQKVAVFSLKDYARSKEPKYYHLYQQALLVPLGDSLARKSLQKDTPDKSNAYRGFLAGHNHEQDISSMINFFLWFDDFPYMREAIDIWTEADDEIAHLQIIGDKIKLSVTQNNQREIELLLQQLEHIDQRLTHLELEFSSVLSEGARWIKQVLLIVSAVLLGIILIITLAISRRIILGIGKTEKALRISNNRFDSLYKYDMLGIVDWHLDGRLLDANEAFLAMTGYQHADFHLGKLNWRDMTPQEYHNLDEQALEEIARKGFCSPFEKEFYCKDGSRIPVILGAAVLQGEGQKGIAYVVDQRDRKNAETELRLSATVFDATNNGILITDNNFQVISVNKAYLKITNYTKAAILGKKARILSDESLNQEQLDQMSNDLEKDGSWKMEHFEKKRNGEIFQVDLSVNHVKDNYKDVSHYVIVMVDISKRKIIEGRLQKMAHFDYLTGLANRVLFDDHIRRALLRAKRNQSSLALLFIDLDQFKPINDQYGHATGDLLLKEIAQRLQANLRENDSVARFGGDEFVILLEDLDSTDGAGNIAQKIIELVNRPVIVEELNLHVGCSIGISQYPKDSDQPDDLLRYSDIAMYSAKEAGRNSYYFFNQQILDQQVKLNKRDKR